MRTVADPAWPLLLLALVQAIDGVLCLRPVQFVRKCLEDVRFPRRWWPVLPAVKFAAAAGLAAGAAGVPVLGAVTVCAVVLFFLLAIAAHLRAYDLGRNLFLNAAGMLALTAGTLLVGFVL